MIQKTWFNRLDWNTDEKFKDLGLNKNRHQEVTASNQMYPGNENNVNLMPNKRPSKKQKRETIVAVMAEDT